MKVSVAQLCLTFWDSMDCSPPGSSVHGIFSRQEYWSGLPFPSKGDLPRSRDQTDSLPPEPVGKPQIFFFLNFIFKLYITVLDLPNIKMFFSYSDGNESACNAGDTGDVVLIPELGRSSEKGNGNPLQYSRPGNPMDKGAWWTTGHGVARLNMT